jgi:hypothetical protein
MIERARAVAYRALSPSREAMARFDVADSTPVARLPTAFTVTV